jgi:hypothetical protein
MLAPVVEERIELCSVPESAMLFGAAHVDDVLPMMSVVFSLSLQRLKQG